MSNLPYLRAALISTFASVACQSAVAQPISGQLAPFEAVSLQGGGEVIVRRGAAHQVRVVRGDPAALEITSVWRRGLRIRCRPNACRNNSPQIEVTTPRVTALAVDGGGSMRVEPGFAPLGSLAVSVNGGGHINTVPLSAANVAASVNGGGNIMTQARSSLAASVRGGGVIGYYGAPQVATTIHGGGVVEPIGGRRRR
jgi:hypothetical protein